MAYNVDNFQCSLHNEGYITVHILHACTVGVSLITGLLITGLDWTGLDWNPKICFYALWYAICHE